MDKNNKIPLSDEQQAEQQIPVGDTQPFEHTPGEDRTIAFEAGSQGSTDSVDDILESLFKGAFFTLQALQFARTGTYPATKTELVTQLEGDEARILIIGRNWQAHRPTDDEARHVLVDLLLRWSEGVVAR